MAIYRTRDGDRLDDICLKYYGDSSNYVEAVLVANPRLADIGTVLPSGIMLDLPDFSDLNESKGDVKLWD